MDHIWDYERFMDDNGICEEEAIMEVEVESLEEMSWEEVMTK